MAHKIKIGDIVLIHDDIPHVDWKLAVIEGLITGGDGLIHAANIRIAMEKTNRPIKVIGNLDITVPRVTNETNDSTDSVSSKGCATDSSTSATESS